MKYGIELIDYKWYGSKIIDSGITTVISGAVLIWTGYNFRAFIGIGTIGDEDQEVEEIIKWGNTISKQEAIGIFGSVEIGRDGKKYSLINYYKI